jgi:HAMP domain-containing protein
MKLVDLAIADEAEEVREVDERVEFLVRDLIILLGVVALLAIGASIGAVRLLGRALSEPITRLTQGAEAIGRGELDHRIAVEGQDELSGLSRDFNEMAAALQEHRTTLLENQSLLEHRVNERTLQLEEANRRLKDLDRLRVLFPRRHQSRAADAAYGAPGRGGGGLAQPQKLAGRLSPHVGANRRAGGAYGSPGARLAFSDPRGGGQKAHHVAGELARLHVNLHKCSRRPSRSNPEGRQETERAVLGMD